MKTESIRYGEAFKRQVVEEVEKGRFRSLEEARKKFGIGGQPTIKRWLKKYGKNHLVPRVVRVESMNERDELQELRRKNKQLEKALAETKVEEVLNRAYLEILCEKYGIEDVEEFKKKAAGRLFDEPKS